MALSPFFENDDKILYNRQAFSFFLFKVK